MKRQPVLNWLIPCIAILTLVSAGGGLFYQKDGSPYPFTTLYGEIVQISGQGLYDHASIFDDATARGTDLVTLFVVLPLMIISFWLFRRGSLRGGILLAGVLAYLFYYGASRGLGTPYNNLFLVYIALFSATFFAFTLALMAIDLPALPDRLLPHLPRRGMAVFMFVAGLGTAFIWLSDAVNALVENRVPDALGAHTTVTTYTLDVGIIAPAALLAGILLLRRLPLGYLLTAVLTIMLALVGAMVIGQTIVQLSSGIQFSPGELIGKVVSWIILGLIAIGLSIAFLRNIVEPGNGHPASESNHHKEKKQ